MDPGTRYVKDNVINAIEIDNTSDFDSEFVFVLDNGATHAMTASQLAAAGHLGGDTDVGVLEIYGYVVKTIEIYNEQNFDRRIVGLVHTALVGEPENEPHLMVIALDETGDGEMTLFPVEESGLGKRKDGTGFSPQLDPWGVAAGRGIAS